jgi:16S rRNA processing protein RimM
MVARLLKPVGLRGVVKAESWSDSPDRFLAGSDFWVMTDPPVRVTLDSAERAERGRLALRFQGRSSVDAVAGWRGCGLAIDESDRAPLPDDRFYYDELEGMTVTLESGEPVGIVRDVWATGPHDLLVIEHESTERMLPMVRAFVVCIDRTLRRVTVRPPNGWMDDVAV